MDRFMRYLTIFCIACILLFSLVYFILPEYIGMAEAKYDLWRGHYEIRVYGFPGFFEGLHAPMLKRYGISYKRVAGCFINHFVVKYANGYNSIMKKAIDKDIGLKI
jgi:hypothetical protein